MSGQKHVKLIVYGRVQGVGFRYFANELAKTLKLTGWVMNCQDGTVELRIEGDRKTIKSFISELERGNQFSHVDRIESEELYRLGEYHDFSVRYF